MKNLLAMPHALPALKGIAGIALVAGMGCERNCPCHQSSGVRACVTSLHPIELVKATWASDNHITNELITPTPSVLYGRTNYLTEEPKCPKGGTYGIGRLNQKPTCSVKGHTL